MLDIGHYWSVALDKLSGHGAIGVMLLLASTAFAAVVTFLQSGQPRSLRGVLAYVWPRHILRHRSARADFLFWATRRLALPLLVVPLTFSTVVSGHLSHRAMTWLLGPAEAPAQQAGTLTLLLFTLSMFLVYDLAYYLYHRLQHQLPILWELHKVHHSAEVMVGVTKDRIHPIDDLMNAWWDGLFGGVAFGIWLFFLAQPVELTLFGISAYVIRQNLIMMDFVRHTHMRLSYGRLLNRIFICPHYHQLHHSVDPRHHDRNFGLALCLWDRIFGTLMAPLPDERFTFGLEERESVKYRSVTGLWIEPLRGIWALLRQGRRARPSAAGADPRPQAGPPARAEAHG